jgi:hypothetical protein
MQYPTTNHHQIKQENYMVMQPATLKSVTEQADTPLI